MANILYKNADKTVNTIAERNAISPKLDDMEVIVLDAIADIEAGPGAAVYKWSESINDWIMLANSKDEPLTSLSFSNDTLTYVDENGTSTDIDLSIYEHADPTILKAADIGVSVQSYSADTVIDANYVHTDNNYTTTEKNKLAGIEDGATADQTKADIDALGIAASTSDTLSTPRSFTIGNTSRTFDGSSDVVWTEEDINSQKYGGVYKYQKIYNVTETTPLKIVDRLDTPVTNGTLRVKAQIPGTGTADTAGSAIFYYNRGVWNVHKSSLSGESSNKVDFFIDVDGDPAVKTWHSSTYSVSVNHEYVQRDGNFVPGFWGIDGELESISGALSYKNDRVFTESYHPNANALTTAREISLTGDASGSVEFDGSGDVSIDVTVANDSHTHDTQYYTKSEIDNIEQVLQTSISGRPTYARVGITTDHSYKATGKVMGGSSNVDWDTINLAGFFNKIPSATSDNTPDGGTGYYYPQIHTYGNTGNLTQFAWPYGVYGNSGNVAYRTRYNGVFNDWVYFYTTNNKPTAQDVGAYTTAQVDAIESGLQSQINDKLDSLVGVKGDMYVHNGTSFVKLNAGLDGQILYADNSEPTGLKWDYPTIG